MPARTKFMQVGGDLIYAKSGARVSKEYTLKQNAAGNTMVYNEKGRLVGYVRNPKTAAEARTYMRAEARVTRTPFWKAAVKEEDRRALGPQPGTALSKKEYEEASFAKALKGSFEAGIITSKEAEEWYQLFKEGSKYTRYGLWEDLKLRDQVKGHPYFSGGRA